MRERAVFFFCVLFALLFTCGCVQPPKITVPEQRKEGVISAPKEKVWQVLVSTIGMNYPLEILDKSSGLITTKQVALPVGFNNSGMEEFAYPPQVTLGTWDGMRVALKILVTELDANKTNVKINASYLVWENNVLKAWLDAPSNGAFENNILTALEKKTSKPN